jgi:predicted NAD/FAD-dependent oxidoreductase
MSNFCVIGSGISGATIANLLNKKHSVDLFDKARGPGGRASFKRLDKTKGFDHGTQYISPKTLAFKKFLEKLIKKKVLKNWSGKHLFLNKSKQEIKNHKKIIGRKGNNDISKYLLKNIRCGYFHELKKIDYKQKKWFLTFSNGEKKIYNKLILTCPFEQLYKLSKKFIKSPFIKSRVKMDANITVMIVIKKTKSNISSYFFDDQILGWAAKENSKKRFKSNFDLWTLQSTYNWANKKINKNKGK